MGLIKCPDCRKKFSDRIDHCPKCGCPKSEIITEDFGKTSVYNDESNEEPLRRMKKPSSKKSKIIVFILWLLMFAYFSGAYMENNYLYDYALLLGWIDFVIFSIIMMLIPLIYGMTKKQCNLRNIKRISLVNSVLILLASIIYSVYTDVLYVGLLGTIFYYFINKHTLILMRMKSTKKNYRRNASITTSIILLILVVSVILSMIFIKSQLSFNENTENNSYVEPAIAYEPIISYDVMQVEIAAHSAVSDK